MDKKKVNLSRSSGEDGTPEAKYTRFGERIRQAIPGPVQCSVGCGGRNCKWENPSRWSDKEQAIKGVYSSWVLNDVVAMSRPSTEVIRKYKMIEQFKKHNVRSIINLQRPGEHASCGPPLDKESLFTYRPQDFMDNDIFFYNFGWKDYGVTSMDTILDMVKVMSFALEEGKVAVHCHAGLGRTGVLIACYLIYAERMDPDAAILKVRKHRGNSIQTRGQLACIHDFSFFLRPLRILFPQVVPHAKRLTLKQFLNRQRQLLHGFESRELRHVPKLIHDVCNRLCVIAHAKPQSDETDGRLSAQSTRREVIAEMKETLPKAFVNEIILNQPAPRFCALRGLDASPPSAKRIISSSVVDKVGTQPEANLDAPNRPRHTVDTLTLSLDEDAVFLEKSSDVSSGSVEKEISTDLSANISGKSNRLDRSQEADKTGVASNVKAGEIHDDAVDVEKLKDIPDEQIERDVDEILGCNTNNNHSIKGMVSQPVHTGVKPVSNKASTSSDSEENNASDKNAIKSQNAPDDTQRPEQTDQSSSNQPTTSMRKMRRSSGRSEPIQPTGLPSKNPRSSAKGPRPASNRDSTYLDSDEAEKETDKGNQAKEIPYPNTITKVHAQVKNLFASPKLKRKKSPMADNKAEDQTSKESRIGSPIRLSQKNGKQKAMFTIPYTDVTLPIPTFKLGNASDSEVSSGQPSDNEDLQMEISKLTDRPQPGTAPDNASLSTSVTSTVMKMAMSPIKQFFDKVTVSVTPSLPTSNDEDEAKTPSGAVELESTSKQSDCRSSTPQEVGLEDLSDENLDEIINIIGDEDQRSFDGEFTNEQLENAENDSSLSHSVASRVSWSHMQQQKADFLKSPNSEVVRKESASSDASHQSGRRTPLMYRAEKNIALLNPDKPTSDDLSHASLSFSTENKSKSDDSDDDVTDPFNVEPDAPIEDSNHNPESEQEHDTSPRLSMPPRLSTARSMSDLASSVHVDSTMPLSRCSSSGDMRHPSHSGRLSNEHINPTNVALALSYKLVDDEWLWEKVYSLQVEINNHKDGWKTVAEVSDPYVLASLMWTWVEHLAEPILTVKDIHQVLKIINRSSPSLDSNHVVAVFERAMSSLEPGAFNTTKCLLAMTTSFPPLPKRIAESVVCRILSALTRVDKDQVNKDMLRIFQQYVNAKYESSHRKRFIDDLGKSYLPNISSHSPSRDVHAVLGEDNHYSPPTFTVDPDIDEILRPSAGSVHSSGSGSAAGMTTPRIAVN